jgi:hypothetical protein
MSGDASLKDLIQKLIDLINQIGDLGVEVKKNEPKNIYV